MPFQGDEKLVRLKHMAGLASYRGGTEVSLLITRMLRRVRAVDLAFLCGKDCAAGFLFPSNLSVGDTVPPLVIDRVTLCGRDFGIVCGRDFGRGDLAVEPVTSCGASAEDAAVAPASLLALFRRFRACFSLFFFLSVSVVGDMITARGVRRLLRTLSSSRGGEGCVGGGGSVLRSRLWF